MQNFEIGSSTCTKKRFIQKWKVLNKKEVENLVQTGLGVLEVQQVAVFGAFLYSVPYIETLPGEYNDKTFIELLNISENIQNVIKRQMDLYAKILNSWQLYIERAQLSKGNHK